MDMPAAFEHSPFDRPSRQPGSDLVPRVATQQEGVFTAAQARADGWTRRQIRRRIEMGRWIPVVGQGLAVAPRAAWTPWQLSYAAVLTVPDAIVSHTTAALLHGWPGDLGTGDHLAHVISTVAHRSPRGMRVHDVSISARAILTPRTGLRVTGIGRTAVDLFSTLPATAGLDLWVYLSSRGLVSLHDLQSVIELRAGMPGIAALRALERHVRSGAVSGAELLLHQALINARIGGWEAGIRIMDGRGIIGVVDVLFSRAKLVIEVDGWRAHQGRPAFLNDRRRQNRLVAAGYTVLRFTWDDLTQRLADVLAQIRCALASS